MPDVRARLAGLWKEGTKDGTFGWSQQCILRSLTTVQVLPEIESELQVVFDIQIAFTQQVFTAHPPQNFQE